HHAAGSGRYLRPDRRTHLPWRVGAGSVLHHASIAGLGPVSHAHKKALFVRLGNPSGSGLDGRVGGEPDTGDLGRTEEDRVIGKVRPTTETRRRVGRPSTITS